MLTLLFSSDRFEKILSQFSQAMIQAINTSHPRCNQLCIFLAHLQRSGIQTKQLTEMAYKWCSAVCENHSILQDIWGMGVVPRLSLKIGFHSPNPKNRWIEAGLTHTEHHQELARIIFGSWDSEAVTDLLYAWTSESGSHEPYPPLRTCAGYLINFHYFHPFSPRLRQCTISAVEFIGYEPFEQAGVGGFVGLLNDLQVSEEDTSNTFTWAKILLGAIQASEGNQYLSPMYYKWFMVIAAYNQDLLREHTYNPNTIKSLESNEEWDKLKCWIIVVWAVWSQEGGQVTVEDLEHVMVSLSHQQPGAVQELEEEMREWREKYSWVWVPEAFQEICERVCDEVTQKATL